MPKRVLAFVAVLFLALISVARAPDPPAPVLRELDEPSLEPEPELAKAPRTIAELRAEIQAILDREQVPGVAIALVDRERVIWSGGVGVRDLATRAPVEHD